MSIIDTFEDRLFDYLHPEEYKFDIDEIAWALSMQCRFNGFVSHFYSVAQHSVLMCDLVPIKLRKQTLLHDGSEALCGDVVSPLKRLLFEYRIIYNDTERAMFKYYKVPRILPPLIKQADLRMLAAEKRDLKKSSIYKYPVLKGIIPDPRPIELWSQEKTYELFMNAWEKYK